MLQSASEKATTAGVHQKVDESCIPQDAKHSLSGRFSMLVVCRPSNADDWLRWLLNIVSEVVETREAVVKNQGVLYLYTKRIAFEKVSRIAVSCILVYRKDYPIIVYLYQFTTNTAYTFMLYNTTGTHRGTHGTSGCMTHWVLNRLGCHVGPSPVYPDSRPKWSSMSTAGCRQPTPAAWETESIHLQSTSDLQLWSIVH